VSALERQGARSFWPCCFNDRMSPVAAISPLLGLPLVSLVLILFAYPAYLLAMAGVLAICGVPRAERAKWVLRQTDRQRFTNLIRAARGWP
jgi:hypothetical protein